MIAPASTVVVTAAEVFNETDPMHCVARIVRKGGGRYMVTDALGQGAQMVDTYADAVGLADKIGRQHRGDFGPEDDARTDSQRLTDLGLPAGTNTGAL